MKFTATRTDLIPVLTRCAAVAAKSSTMPILANVLLSAADDLLTVSATDLSISVTGKVCTADADSGSVAVEARALLDRVKAMPDGAIFFATKGDTLEMKAKGSSRRYTLHSIPGSEFPNIPDPGSAKTVAAGLGEEMAAALGTVAFTVSTDDTRLHLASLLLKSDGEKMVMVATDGHRLTLATMPSTAKVRDILIPRPALREIKAAAEDGGCSLRLDGYSLFIVGNMTTAVKLTDAQFPPYEQVIPKDHKRIITLDRGRFIDALRRAQLMSSETRGVKVAATKDGVTITSDNPDLGEVREELEAEYNGEPIAIGFNPKYVVELLSQMSCDQITIALGGELDPGLIRPLTGDDYLGVVMPMRI